MFTNLSTRLAVTTTATYTQSVSMDGADAAGIDCTIYSNSGANNALIQLQGSDDLENWTTIGEGVPEAVEESAAGHYKSDPVLNIGHAYVRLKSQMETGGTTICGVGIITFEA